MNYELLLYQVLNDAPIEFRANYLFRELKKAEADYYTSIEFFSGCTNVLQAWDNGINQSYEIAQANLLQKKNRIYMAEGTEEQEKRALAQLEIERKATTIETMAIPILDNNIIIGSIKLADVNTLVGVVMTCSNMVKEEIGLNQKQADEEKKKPKLSLRQVALMLVYNGVTFVSADHKESREKLNSFAATYGHESDTSGTQLYKKHFNKLTTPTDRTGVQNKRKMKCDIEAILHLLTTDGKALAKADLKKLELATN